MIDIDSLFARLSGLQRRDLDRWIANEWIRPDRLAGRYVFHEIDVARVRLIQQLRDEMQVDEDALPIVLSLLDQLYDHRRRMRELIAALARTAPEEMRQHLAQLLATRTD